MNNPSKMRRKLSLNKWKLQKEVCALRQQQLARINRQALVESSDKEEVLQIHIDEAEQWEIMEPKNLEKSSMEKSKKNVPFAEEVGQYQEYTST